jgi:hypothetical protein
MAGFTDIIAVIKDATEKPWREAKAEEAKRNKLLNYESQLLDNVQYSPRQFYASLIENLRVREVPGLETEAVLLRQSGIFSAKRLYLQFRRERLVFEICAAPFGTGFFCSERLYDRRREARWYHFLMVAGFLSLSGFLLWVRLDVIWSIIALSGAVTLVWSLMRLSVLDTMRWLEDRLYDVPVLGPIYTTFFRPDTYFRQDLNSCYRQAVHRAVTQTINDLRREKGLVALSQEQSAPRVQELHLR